MRKLLAVGAIVVTVVAFGYVGGAYADPIGTSTNPCANNSCFGSIYTMTTNFVDVGSSSTTDTFDVTLTVDTSGFNAGSGFSNGFLNAVAIKVAPSLVSGALLSGPAGFVENAGGLNAGGCSGVASGFDCAQDSGTNAPVPNGTYTFVFEETIAAGSLFTLPNESSVKALYVGTNPANGKRATRITSENITLQNSNPRPPVPEPATLLLLGSGLAGLGWFGRKRRGEDHKS